MRRLSLGVFFIAGCTAANPLRATDLGVTADLSGRGGEDLASTMGSDLAEVDLASTENDLAVQGGDDMAGSDMSVATDMRMKVDLRSTDLATGCFAPFQGPQTSFFLYGQSLTTNVPSPAPVILTIPDGYRVHGTVTLTGGLGMVGSTDGGAPAVQFDSGEVALVNLGTGESFPGVNLMPSPPASFSYESFVPGGDYQMRVIFRVTVSDPEHPGFDSTVTRLFDAPTLTVCGDTPKDIDLAALPSLVMKRVRVSGVSALNPTADGMGLHLETTNGELTISKFVNRVDDGVTRNVFAADNVPLPEGETLYATLQPFRNPNHASRQNGYDARINMNDALVVGSNPEPFAVIALPPVQTLSGSVTNGFNQLFPVGADPSFFTHAIYCDRDQSDTRVPELSTGYLFTDLLSYKMYVRNGVSCRVTGAFVVGTPSPGMLPTNERENSYAVLLSPGEASNETINAPLARNFTVPNLGTQIKVAVAVRDIRNAPLPGYKLFLDSESLADANLANERLRSEVLGDGSGTADAHILPGTYRVRLRKP